MNLLDDLESMIGTEFLIENEQPTMELTAPINSNLTQTEQPHANKIVLIK
mgnify:CR=1 FL=1